MKRSGKRFWELDICRGLAVAAMVIFNWLFTLNYLGVYSANVTEGFWFYFARMTAAAFILIAGISLSLSVSFGKQRREIIKRGLFIFSLGLLITIVTWIFLKEVVYVRFGILHLIGLSIILAYPLAKLRYANLLAGIGIAAAGIYLKAFSFGFSWLLWLGLAPKNLYTVDYFPLLPWFGVFLIGVYLGNSLYENGARKYAIRDYSGNPVIGALAFLGRNSLLIYLLHQPALIAALYLSGFSVIF